jgi:hypothetical protein
MAIVPFSRDVIGRFSENNQADYPLFLADGILVTDAYALDFWA